MTKQKSIFLLLSIGIIIIDQLTKYWANHGLEYLVPNAVISSLNWRLVYNYGAAFSLLADQPGWQRWFFVLVSGTASVVLLAWLWRIPANDRLTHWGVSLLLAGAAGNLIDRLFFGYVVDFIDVYYQDWHWPTFNIADIAVNLGVLLLLLSAFMPAKQPIRK